MKKFFNLIFSLGMALAGILATSTVHAQVVYNLKVGWNLLGNAESNSLDVTTTFGDPGKINTVWKWNGARNKWEFYTPLMLAPELTTYAQSKGYDVLTSISPKEGFWVNSNVDASLSGPIPTPLSPGTPAVLTTLQASDLSNNWNLLASSDVKTPSQINASLSSSLALIGKSITSAWAWDTSTNKWRFYAPSLAVQVGTVLADYITSKGYLPFTTAIKANEGYWVNVATESDTTTTTTTTTATTTTTTNLSANHYLYLANDTISYHDGFSTTTPYTLAQFQAKPGISVQWPMRDTASLRFTLSDGGGFNVIPGQTLSAAVSISDTTPGSQGVIKFDINKIDIVKNGTDITLTVPSSALAWVYGVLTDGSGAAIKPFSSSVANATTTISTAPNTVSSIFLGGAINSAINSIGSASSMTGTYKVTLVVTNLQLTQANGTSFNTYQVDVPTSLANSSVRSTVGLGLEGYVTLTP